MPAAPVSLEDWLAYVQRLHHRPIDLTLERPRAVLLRAAIRFECPVVMVGGTNGKGSTCALLESIFRAAGYRTGLYTSPHLLRFNERACVDGVPIDDAALIAQFAYIESLRGDISLTYFEFTTLAIFRHLAASGCDVVILEVGLGGRLDAVNLIDADCSILTSVDLDHMDFLGPDREAIGFEKAHIFRTGRTAICGDPQPPASVLAVAETLGADLRLFGRDFNYQGDRQQWSFAGRRSRRSGLPYPALRGANQLLNASAALAALEAMADTLPVSQQAVRQGLLAVNLPGRFQIRPGKPSIVFDVAHNPHAAAVLSQNLGQQGFFPRTFAVFAALRDKDIGGIVAPVIDSVDHWLLAPLPGERGTAISVLQGHVQHHLDARGSQGSKVEVSLHDTVASAYRAAKKFVGPDDRIVVFGSFLTVAAAMSVDSVDPASPLQ